MKRTTYFFGFAFIFLFGCQTYVVTSTESTNQPIVETQSENTELTTIITPYKDSLSKTMNGIIGYSEEELTTGSPEGKLGNFIADLSLSIGNQRYDSLMSDTADFVILNNGGFRTFMPAGAITTGKIFEIMPFENELVVVTLSIKKTVELFEYIGAKTVKDGNRKQGVPISGNVRVELMGNTPIEVLVDSIRLRGRPYKVITTDYLANGGDNMSFFLEPLNYEKLDLKLRDAILQQIDNLEQNGLKVSADLDKRIQYVD